MRLLPDAPPQIRTWERSPTGQQYRVSRACARSQRSGFIL